jgi:hypothetical protein
MSARSRKRKIIITPEEARCTFMELGGGLADPLISPGLQPGKDWTIVSVNRGCGEYAVVVIRAVGDATRGEL